jgi:indole-3-glycerol phosphate synthase
MIYEAKLLGASAVLLICAVLEQKQLREYIKIADSLGLSCLVETHNEEEIAIALKSGARVIGVNNRDLATFEVDITLSERLRKLVPPDMIFVAESGISTPADVARLQKSGVNAVLIGEALMKGASLDWLRSRFAD